MNHPPRWERDLQERPEPDEPAAQRRDETAEFDVEAGFDELDPPDGSASPARQQLAIAADRITRWFAGLDRRPEFDPGDEGDPESELLPGPDPKPRPGLWAGAGHGARPASGLPASGPPASGLPATRDSDPGPTPEPEGPSRFPLSPLGYNRQAVDQHLVALERELSELRERMDPPISITEEIERIGEQTASILVVAHDKAHETTRMAHEQAERCVEEAAANAVAITAEAKQRLRELDEETDSVWRERERLLDDVRVVSASLTTLADDASARFPADAKPQELSTNSS